MAMKSDFAQKLLNDLRLKKERMAASHSSGNSSTMTRDGQRHSSQTYRGSHKIKGAESGRPNTANLQRRTSGSARLLTDKENSSQLVQYRSGQSSGQRVDLPMAFLLALQNSGKHGRSEFSGSNPMLQFLQQIGKKSLDTGKMAGDSSLYKHHSSTNHFPTFSNLHVNEISKGVQHLNHILKACSNGLNIDKYSIEVGKELLKGATDLEESLRMLVNLQEASEYMIKPQRKNRITLLEEEEDDEANNGSMIEQKQLDLPRFSFDKRSRNSHGYVTKTDPNQRLIELTYHAKSSSFSNNQTLNFNSEPHRRSSSWSPNFKAPTDPELKNHSNSSQAVPEKGRISSVIAKLMGLEEIPEKVHSQKRQRESGMRNGEGTGLKMTTKNAEIKTKTERQETTSKIYNVLKQDHKVSEIKNRHVSQKAEMHHVSLQLNSVVVIADENSQRKNQERVKRNNEGSGPGKIATKIDEQQSSINRSIKIVEYQKNVLEIEAGQGSAKHKQLKTTEKSEPKEPVIRDEMQQKVKHNHRRSKDAIMLQEEAEQKEVTAQTEKRNSERLTPKTQQKTQQDNGLHALRKSDIQKEKHQTKKREEPNIISNLVSATKNESSVWSKVPSKTLQNAKRSRKKHPPMNQAAATRKIYREACDEMPQKEQPNNIHEQKIVKHESAASNVLINMDQNASPRELASQMPNEKDIMLPLNQKKPVHVLATGKKAEITQKLRGQTLRKINEKMNKKNDTLTKNLVTASKHQNEVTQESRQSMQDTDTEIEGTEPLRSAMCQDGERSLKETKSEETVKTLNTDEQKHLVSATTIITSSSQNDECSSLEVALPQDTDDSIKDISNKVQPSLSEQKSLEMLPNSLNGSNERCPPKLQEHKKASLLWKQELLTENEKKLKETLIKSPLFLNTAEALFKLNIPVGILHASDQIYQEKAAKFTIDCAYEVMNRKGRRQELLQPCLKISISNTMVSSLDNLIKQLYKDFERLQYYGGNEHDDHDDAETLLKILERDIQNTDPHLNCMWDFGWNNVMFAFDETSDVIKDVERQVLEELIDEITRDI